MVEVTLAIATVGIGVAGVMAMFPVAINSTRDAVAQNFCADGVDQFIAVISNIASTQSDWTTGYVDNIPTSNSVYAADTTNEGNAFPAAPCRIGNIFFPNSSTPLTSGTAVLAMGGQDGSTTPDFTAGVRFYKDYIRDLYLDGQSYSFNNYAYGFNLHIEVSWPLSKPYLLREKRYYVYELFNANK